MASPAFSNLPFQLSSFIGRERESADVAERLATSRLVTLTGPGGCGKTRLAAHVARAVSERYADGIGYVPLAPLSDPVLVPQAVASVLACPEQPDRAPMDTLAEHLRPKQVLLVLDNCEHLITACAELATALLQACPDLRILATSREPFNVDGEFVWIVPSLSVPPPTCSLSCLQQYDAVRLFVDRAAALSSTFELTRQNAESIAQICRRLDGIPLAIELAAARVTVMNVEQIAERLDDTLRLLTRGKRLAPQRHQTMRAALDWSHALLSAPEQILFRRLAVFAGTWTLEAAERVCSDGAEGRRSENDVNPNDVHPSALIPHPSEILDLLTQLVDKSLVTVHRSGSKPATYLGGARYQFLEPTRQYAWQKLVESGEAEHIHGKHLAYFLSLVEQESPEIGAIIRQEPLERLEQEHDNLRGALRWALEHGAIERAVRLATALEPFWEVRGYFHEGRQWLLEVLEAGRAHFGQNDTAAYRALYARLQLRASMLYRDLGDYAAGRALADAALSHFRSIDDRAWTARALRTLGRLLYQLGDDLEARRLVSESLALFRDLDDKRGMADSLNMLVVVSLGQADHETARRLLDEAIPLARQSGDLRLISLSLNWLGRIAIDQGALPEARGLIQESLQLRQQLGYKVGILEVLITTASLASATAQAQRAVRLCGAVEGLRVAFGSRLRRLVAQRQTENIAAARAQLDDPAFNAAWVEGQGMSIAEAIAEAEHVLRAVETTRTLSFGPAAPRDPNALTAREQEVLRLVVAGLSDAQIADKLVISRRTVNTHLTSIYSKLGVNSRSAAARYVLDHQLL